MLKTWSFWKTFFATYIPLVAGIWGFVEAYTYFEGDALKQLLGSYWWVIYYVIPLFVAFSVATLQNAREETQVESLDQHNRRIMLNHVETFWVKGLLEKSLHGTALLELGIKEDLTAINYPWIIKKESTNETLPAGKSMLEIFEEIGAGRSLLILGTPGSGKTTMLLELARLLIERARNNETEPIPVVFNLASWTEKQSLADWLAGQLNIFYYVPKKTAQKWVSESKMLLLLDGLDEVKQENRTKCVEAINQFRNEHGLTSLVVCTRIEDYAVINTKLSLEGAITIQPLTPKQVNAYFDKLGKSMAGVKQLLKKDKTLRELAETPLMLSIMALAYKDKKPEELLSSNNKVDQRKHLFDTYIDRMFERSTRPANYSSFTKSQTLHYLYWLARTMIQDDMVTYQIEEMQSTWLENKIQESRYVLFTFLAIGLIFGLVGGLVIGQAVGSLSGPIAELLGRQIVRQIDGLRYGLVGGLIVGLLSGLVGPYERIEMVDKLSWSWKEQGHGALLIGLVSGLIVGWYSGLMGGISVGLVFVLVYGLSGEQIKKTTQSGQRLRQTYINSIFAFISVGLSIGLILEQMIDSLHIGLYIGLFFGVVFGLDLGGLALIQHYVLRFLLTKYRLLPQHLIHFLEYTTDLIFLRRVGGSYIFVHRLLMEHFAKIEEEKI